MEFLDEKMLALRNEMREQKHHEQAQQMKGVEQTGPAEQPAVDLLKDFITIHDKAVKMQNIALLDNQIMLRIPALFTEMPKELAELKYPSARRPNVILTDESTTVNITFNFTTNELSNEEVAAFRDGMIEVLEQMQPAIEWFDIGGLTIQGKAISYFEMLTPALDGDIFNLMFFCSLQNRALIGTFNCMAEDLDEWEPVAQAIMRNMQFVTKLENGGISL